MTYKTLARYVTKQERATFQKDLVWQENPFKQESCTILHINSYWVASTSMVQRSTNKIAMEKSINVMKVAEQYL